MERHLRHVAYVDTGSRQGTAGPNTTRESLVERATLRFGSRADYFRDALRRAILRDGV